MKFLEFREQFKEYNVITFQDVQNVFGDVNQSQFSTWKEKGYILSVKKGMYVLGASEIDPLLLANELNDSYISLEFALSHHQLIPEITSAITSVSNNRTGDITNQFGNYYYHKISSKLFCGFELIKSNIKADRFIRIASKEKALFDLIYMRSDLGNDNDFAALRLNIEKVNIRKIQNYIDLVDAPQRKERLNNFVKYLNAIV